MDYLYNSYKSVQKRQMQNALPVTGMEERMKLYDSGVYLVNGKEIMTEAGEVQ